MPETLVGLAWKRIGESNKREGEEDDMRFLQTGFMIKRLLWICVILTLGSLACFGETPQKAHLVKEVLINVEGTTKTSALRAVIKIKENDKFSSGEKFLQDVERERQNLVNKRVFRYVNVRMELLDSGRNTLLWRLIFDVEDRWTFYPLIYPKFDSNTGLKLGTKLFYDNAFGTMTDIFLGIGINFGINKTTEQLEVGSWSINPKWENIRIGSLLLSLGFLQAYDYEKFESGSKDTEFHYSYYESEFSIGSSIGIYKSLLKYDFGISMGVKYLYNNFLTTKNYKEEPINLGWQHALSLGHIDWKGNFRHGQQLTLQHGISPVFNNQSGEYFVTNFLNLTGGIYRPFAGIFNFYGLASAFVSFNRKNYSVGTYLRGVSNYSMSGDWGFYFNTSIGIRFWRLKKVWDAQVHPFFDIGMASPYGGPDINRDLRYGAGLDFVLFLDKVPNLVARGMIGVDLSRHEWNNLDKYEFTITSSLHY